MPNQQSLVPNQEGALELGKRAPKRVDQVLFGQLSPKGNDVGDDQREETADNR